MGKSRDNWVLAATVVAESTWTYGLLAVVGAIAGAGGSPLGWPAVLAIMALSLVVGLLSPINVDAIEAVYLVRTLIGALVVYLAVGTQVASGTIGLDILWVTKFGSESAVPYFTFKAVGGAVAGAVLWWRAGQLPGAEFPADVLGFSFRLGLLALAATVGVDIAVEDDLNTAALVFVFFAAGLGGLSIGYLLPESEQAIKSKTWPKVITGLVSVVLVSGFVFALLHRDILSYLAVPARAVSGALVTGVLWAVIIPISFIFNLFVEAIIGFFKRAYDPPEEEQGEVPQQNMTDALRTIQEEGEEEVPEILLFVIQVVEWVFVALVAILLLYLLSRVLRQFFTKGPKEMIGLRESLRDEADPASDFGRLMLKLIPSWLRGRRRGQGIGLPDGPPGVVDILKLYYELLALGEKKGIPRPAHETPTEFQPRLEVLFPRNLVRLATGAFNRACYGNHPSTEQQISQIRTSLTNIKTASAVASGQETDLRLSRSQS